MALIKMLRYTFKKKYFLCLPGILRIQYFIKWHIIQLISKGKTLFLMSRYIIYISFKYPMTFKNLIYSISELFVQNQIENKIKLLRLTIAPLINPILAMHCGQRRRL